MATGLTVARTHEGDRGLAAVALVAIVLITIAWWALALWPVGADAPEWMLRTRFACFGARGSELPHAGGWVLLIGEPIGMLGTLYAVWGDALRRDVARMRGRGWGRGILATLLAVVVVGAVLATRRVTVALAAARVPPGGAPAQVIAASERLPAPALVLVDQHGDRFDLAALRGGPVLVTFAFGHCETVCPTIVREAREARLAAGAPVPLVVVTVDPWRDVPERLSHIAGKWELEQGDRLVGGEVDEVLRALREWGVAITRDERTGEVAHPGLVLLVDVAGRIAARLPGDLRELPALLRG